jgi:hypothetical protein
MSTERQSQCGSMQSSTYGVITSSTTREESLELVRAALNNKERTAKAEKESDAEAVKESDAEAVKERS